MKNISIALILIFGSLMIKAQTTVVNIGLPITVAPSTFDNVRPRIALTNNNSPIIMWGKGSNKKIFTARYNGGIFDTPVSQNPGTLQAFVTDWASAEMASSGDTVFVVYKSEPALTGGIYLTRSLDGGITFSDTVRVDNIDPDISRFANIAISPGGNPVVTFMKFEPGWFDPQYSVANSTDGGNTFLTDVVATSIAPGEACDCCPATMAIKDDKQVVLFRNNIGNLRNMWGSLSTDGGQSFTSAGEIDQSNWNLNTCPSSGPMGFIYGDSMVYTWMSGASGSNRVYFGTVNLNNWQVGINQMIAPIAGGSQNMPRIAGNADTLAIVWEQISGMNRIIMMTWSVTGPAGLAINIDTIASSMVNLVNPDIAFANGVFHISYQDDASGTVLYKTATVTTLTNLNEINADNSLYIYPNPADNEIHLKYDGEISELYITDIQGKIVLQFPVRNHNNSLDISKLITGTYIIHIKNTTGGKTKKKFSIER